MNLNAAPHPALSPAGRGAGVRDKWEKPIAGIPMIVQEAPMKIFRTEEYNKKKNPIPGEKFRSEILAGEDQAKDLGGIFVILVPGSGPPYHYHEKRESVIVAISGEATEILEGKEIPIKGGDVIYIPAGEKHTTVNKSSQEFRYLEFFTCPPVGKDFLEVK
jgi:quercetin dioxygenase-like cupin family protein